MPKTTHTPGPWEADHAFNGLVHIIAWRAGELTNKYIATVPKVSKTLEEDKANIRLIIAAPDLYAACVALVEAFDSSIGSITWREERKNEGLRIARAALAAIKKGA